MKFVEVDAKAAAQNFCNRGDQILEPGNTFGIVESYDTGRGNQVIVSAEWAEDQTGCGDKVDVPLSKFGCTAFFTPPWLNCGGTDDEDSESYGGAWVFDSGKRQYGGCILISMFSIKV